MSTKHLPEMIGSGEYTVFLIHNHDQKDFFGGRRMMESASLHEVSWEEEPEHGVRRPPSGRLESEETRLQPDRLVTLDCMRKREEEGVRSGEDPFLPRMNNFARSRVGTDRM